MMCYGGMVSVACWGVDSDGVYYGMVKNIVLYAYIELVMVGIVHI